MRYSYNWLKEIAGSKMSVEKVVENITMHSFEVEEFEKVGSDFANVVIGEILEIEKHPNADRLQVTKVDVGPSLPTSLPKGERGRGNIIAIVCGARNISVGDKVPVALVGAILPGGFEIKEAEIRGVKSFGMLCAEDELGLGTDHSGILLLDKKLKVGTAFAKTVSSVDTILDIKVLPDRAHDALSHVGMAREIAAFEGKKIDYDYEGLALPKKKTKTVSVEIASKEICSRYIAARLDGVKIGKSPEWLKTRLERCGIRSISNVVDVTNYVMLETGQPLHAFDFSKIKSEFPISKSQFPNKSQNSNDKNQIAEIIVRKAKSNETIKLLDGSEKVLTGDDIVIASKKEILAIAGVMGGEKSGVTEETKTIVLESATFNATNIRKTKNRLNLQTDAAIRFEKKIDPNLAEKAMTRAIELLEYIAEGKIEGIFDLYPQKTKSWSIALDGNYVEKLLGENIDFSKAKKISHSLGFGIKGSGKKLAVEVPTYRLDVLTQEDLIEEIGRILGYEKISPKPLLAAVALPEVNEKRVFSRKVKNILASQGFSEAYSYSFYGKKELELFDIEHIDHLELEMPLSPELSLMRISLLPYLLKATAENLKNYEHVHLFETGKVFWKQPNGLPQEKNMLMGISVCGENGKKAKKRETSFYQAKSHVETFLQSLGIASFYFDTLGAHPIENFEQHWHSGRSAEIKIEGSEQSIGFIGEVNPALLAKIGIEKRVVAFEFDMAVLMEVAKNEREFSPISKFPTSVRDIAMIVKGDILVDQILRTVQKSGGDLVLDTELFDIYDYEDGSTSYAFHIILGSNEKTLTSAEADETMQKITTALENELGVEIRK